MCQLNKQACPPLLLFKPSKGDAFPIEGEIPARVTPLMGQLTTSLTNGLSPPQPDDTGRVDQFSPQTVTLTVSDCVRVTVWGESFGEKMD